MPYTLKIPVHPHVKKYLLHYYTEPIQAPITSPIGTIFHSLLETNQNIEPKKYEKKYSDSITFLLSDKYELLRGSWMSNYSLHLFNTQIDRLLRDNLFTAIYFLDLTGYNVIKRQLVIAFLRLHNIQEDDIATDTIIRDYYRFAEDAEIKSKLFNSQVSHHPKGLKNNLKP